MLQSKSISIFIVATHGDGGPPENSIKFEKLLQEKTLFLSEMKFCVFGLGDSSYVDTYNSFGKFIREKLIYFGATEFMAMDFADC